MYDEIELFIQIKKDRIKNLKYIKKQRKRGEERDREREREIKNRDIFN